MNVFRRYRKIFTAVLYPTLFLLFLNYTSNGHYHRLPEGNIIYHTHPYNKSAETSVPFHSNHHHSKLQLTIISLVTKVLHSGFLWFLMIAAILLPLFKVDNLIEDNLIYNEPALAVSSRDPPVA